MRDSGGSFLRERWWTVLVIAGAVLLTFYRLGAGSLWDQDETKYAQIAREILKTGDLVTLRMNGQPWYVHPPLYMWLVAATGRLAGFNEWTVRLWSAAASVFTVYATILLGRALFGARTGVLAGAVLAVTFHFLVQSRLAVFDTLLLLWMLLATYAFARGYETGGRAHYLRFFLWCGLATLTKGPIGLILPGLIAMVFVTIRGAWRRWREVPWGPGLAVYAVVGLSWYIVETWLHGGRFVGQVLGYYGVGRFFGVVENQAGPWYYYVPILLVGAFPWTVFWPSAAVLLARRARVHDGSLLVLLWVVLTVVFYSTAETKLPNYVLPVYPFAALGVAAFWDEVLRGAGGRAVTIAAGLLVALVGVMYAEIAGYLRGLYADQFHTLGHVLVWPGGALVAGLCVTFALAAARRQPAAFVALCAAMAATWLGILTWIVPVVESEKPMKPLALEIRQALQPDDRITGYRLNVYSSLIYYTDHNVDWVETPDELRREVCEPGRVFVVITTGGWREVRGDLPGVLRPFAERNGVVVLLKPTPTPCG